MKFLFDRITILYEDGHFEPEMYLSVNGKRIEYIGKEKPTGTFDRIFSGEKKLLCPGFYNCHTHLPMNIFRGYAEDLPLSRWLNEKIFPAEDKLYPEAVRVASKFAMAEMIRGGTTSFSDMYFFCDDIVASAVESGMKGNISRSTVSFDPHSKADVDSRFQESVALYEQYHNFADGRIKIDMSIHAQYSTVPASCRYISDFAVEKGLPIQIHLSETASEHQDCLQKYGITPTDFFEENGVFRTPVTAAHCVHVTDQDIKKLEKYGATVVHNPASNLKLGSGVMRMDAIFDAGINVTLGTDGAASNNTLDIMKEAYLAAILQKGITGDTAKMKSSDYIAMITKNGAKSQGRVDCGKIQEGYCADLVVLDLDRINTTPRYNVCDSFLYCANASNVTMTMVDGKILYENGEFLTLDIEKIKFDLNQIAKSSFGAMK